MKRRHQANDASEADTAVLEMLLASQQPLSQQELACTVTITNEAGSSGLAGNMPFWQALERRLAV